MFKIRYQGISFSILAITFVLALGFLVPPVSAGTVPVALCYQTCTLSPSPSEPILLYWGPYPAEMTPGQGIAWTIFDDESPVIPTEELIEYFCMSGPNACYKTIYTESGSLNIAQRAFRCAFYNPLYDSSNKTCEDGTCDSSSDIVKTWKVLVPVFTESEENPCPPGNEPYPKTVGQYAKITISDVYAGGSLISGCACEAYDAPVEPPGSPNAIVIESIECISCEDFQYEPSPDIKANGSDGPLTISRLTNLSITISLDTGSYTGENADWWVLAYTPMGWLHWPWSPGILPTLQGPLFDLSTLEILNKSGLPPGLYIFYFAVDTNMNGLLNLDQMYKDAVVVIITPS